MTAQTIDTTTTTPAVGETVTTADLSMTTTRELLLDAVTFASGASNKRAYLPVLAHLVLEPGTLRAFDYETGAVESLPVDGFGAVAVHADTLGKMIKSLDKGTAVTITASATTTTRERKSRQYDATAGGYVEELETYADHVVTAARIEIGADGVTVATTDRYRLTAQTFAPIMSGDARAFLLPVRSAVWAAKQLSGRVTVRVSDGIAELSDGQRSVTLRMIDGEFPRYRSLIPTDLPCVVTFDVAAMTKAVKRMSVSLDTKASPIVLELNDGAVIVRAGKSSERVAADTAGLVEPMTIGYNAAYLLDGLAFDGASSATLSLVSAVKPAVIRGARDGSVYLLMPVRLGDR